MQLTIGKFLIAFCFLQALKPETFIWAQDAAISSAEVTTQQINSGEEDTTGIPNSLEILASSESLEDITTTVSPSDDCDDSIKNDSGENCRCSCTTNAESAEETTTSASISEEETTTIVNDDDDIETTTIPNNESISESSVGSSEESSTSTPALAPTSTPAPTPISTPAPTPSFICTNAGNFAKPGDCRHYYSCTPSSDSAILLLSENICPDGQAFNTDFSTCLRDLSTCSPELAGFECLESGSFADPLDNSSSYFRCIPRPGGEVASYHLYHIKCGAGKIYMPELGKCFFDFNSPQLGSIPIYSGLPDDEQLVKAEIKQWKLKEKSLLKQEKLKLKYEKKLQKELAKKAKKEAKEKAKNEEKAKKEKLKYDYDD